MMASRAEFQHQWQTHLSEYVTALVWLPNGLLATSSAAGEVVVWAIGADTSLTLQTATGHAVDCLAVAHNGAFLAAGGQDGIVRIWQLSGASPELVASLENKSVWVERMAWSPAVDQLAFSLGRYVQVWDAAAQAVISTLNFEASTVLGMDWHPAGTDLALCGYQGARIWSAADWDEEPQALLIPSASVTIAWSPDGKYVADGNMDNTLTVLEWEMPANPWVMRGFPGKVRHLAWSQALTAIGAPLLAACSSESVVVWERDADETVGWASQVLEAHEGIVQAIGFQPQTLLLASAATDGTLCLWHNGKQLQRLELVNSGFSCLGWHPQGHQLAAGGINGEVCVWAQTTRGQGFGRRS